MSFARIRPTATSIRSGRCPSRVFHTAPVSAMCSTDIILGAYYYRPISENFDVIVNGQFQSALADVPDTVGTVAYLSPGATAQLLPQLHVFGFVQVPVYSNLDGYQLFPRFTVSVGLSYAFGSG